MKRKPQLILFALFFISGCCGLLYQLVWVRMAFASFGVGTPVLSVVISVFMLGLFLGSWAGGKLISILTQNMKVSAIMFYALAELVIGVGAFLVPLLFSVDETILLNAGNSDSFFYLLFSAALIAISLFPWCVFMGTTFPFMMAFIKETDQSNATSFSFLYLANVIGAMFGALMTPFVLIELLGFRHTLWVGGCLNCLIATVSLALGISSSTSKIFHEPSHESKGRQPISGIMTLGNLILFATGFISLAMEVVWTRAFTPIMGTQVYSFAVVLFVYLLATWAGSYLYRRRNLVRVLIRSTAELVGLLTIFAFLPVVINDPRIHPSSFANIGKFEVNTRIFPFLASIFPFCVVLGYLTPQLIDEYSGGNPRKAGKAYAVNILGCILGPLFASYVFLPWVGAKLSMVVLAIPFLIFYGLSFKSLSPKWRWSAGLVSSALLVISLFLNISYETYILANSYEVRRDHTATTISFGEGMQKRLSINGWHITYLTPITKFMAHLPLTFHRGQPQSALVICFGMGTTFRSLLSWDVQATAVELLPSVKEAFGYYFDDAASVMKNPKGQVVIDDGRRFLRRTKETFDVITVDPPPPAEAAGSSLLYSEEFYDSVKKRLKPNGILQQWFAVGEKAILQAVARSITNSFPYVRVYTSVEGWGYHFLASMSPIVEPTVDEMISRLPEQARKDLLEWSQDKNLRAEIDRVLSREIPIRQLLAQDPRIRITDDQPFNEYYLLRRLMAKAPIS